MVLLPDWVGGRKTVVKQGIVIEKGRGEGGLGGGREKCGACTVCQCMLGGGKVEGNLLVLPCKCLPHVLFHLPQE